MGKLKRWLGPLLLLFLLALVGFVVWASAPSSPMPEALAALQSDSQVRVETKPWLIFRLVAEEPTVGLILYPGGRVDPRAYAPAARAIAAAGYLVVIVPMPLNLAVFGSNRAAGVMAAFPEVERWVVGGHSLGGAMAARFAHRRPSAVQGLVLWASYPAASDDLSARDLAVASIYGTRDGLATGEKIAASRPLLPAETRWMAIAGGNHAQFG
ncbi:MAG: alpha/beta hydrolase, partial [Anaerolineae bacterium]|nr:alpha/beta hydrolase [Anaerolineae bacterium]